MSRANIEDQMSTKERVRLCLSEGLNITETCKKLGVHRDTVRKYKKQISAEEKFVLDPVTKDLLAKKLLFEYDEIEAKIEELIERSQEKNQISNEIGGIKALLQAKNDLWDRLQSIGHYPKVADKVETVDLTGEMKENAEKVKYAMESSNLRRTTAPDDSGQ